MTGLIINPGQSGVFYHIRRWTDPKHRPHYKNRLDENRVIIFSLCLAGAMVARTTFNRDARGSSPLQGISLSLSLFCPVGAMVAHTTFNRGARGSSPLQGTVSFSFFSKTGVAQW